MASLRCYRCGKGIHSVELTLKSELRKAAKNVGWDVGIPLRHLVSPEVPRIETARRTADICPDCVNARIAGLQEAVRKTWTLTCFRCGKSEDRATALGWERALPSWHHAFAVTPDRKAETKDICPACLCDVRNLIDTYMRIEGKAEPKTTVQ
jgi:hypothetical protein